MKIKEEGNLQALGFNINPPQSAIKHLSFNFESERYISVTDTNVNIKYGN